MPLRVGETWAGKRPTPEQFAAAEPLAKQVHPFLQGAVALESTLRAMVAEPGFSVAYINGGDSLRVWAFGRIKREKVGGGLGRMTLRRSTEYLFEQFGVTTAKDVVSSEGQAQHRNRVTHRKAASALLWCAVEDLPESAMVHMRMIDQDSRSEIFFRDHAGFRIVETNIEAGSGEYIVSASVDEIRNNLMSRDHDFLSWRLPIETT